MPFRNQEPNDRNTRYSIALLDMNQYRNLWGQLPEIARGARQYPRVCGGSWVLSGGAELKTRIKCSKLNQR